MNFWWYNYLVKYLGGARMDFAAILEYVKAMVSQEEFWETINGFLKIFGELAGTIFQ